jgi:hypothetical protein
MQLKEKYDSSVVYIPAFHGFESISQQHATGTHILYHGDLSIMDNEKCVNSLVDAHVASGIKMKLIVAGRKPSKALNRKLEKLHNVLLEIEPTDEKLESLIKDAHANVVWSSNDSGIKIKLVHALILGKFCIVNEQVVKGNSLGKYCRVLTDKSKLPAALQDVVQQEYNMDFHKIKLNYLNKHFSNKENALKILNLLRKDFN